MHNSKSADLVFNYFWKFGFFLKLVTVELTIFIKSIIDT